MRVGSLGPLIRHSDGCLCRRKPTQRDEGCLFPQSDCDCDHCCSSTMWSVKEARDAMIWSSTLVVPRVDNVPAHCTAYEHHNQHCHITMRTTGTLDPQTEQNDRTASALPDITRTGGNRAMTSSGARSGDTSESLRSTPGAYVWRH